MILCSITNSNIAGESGEFAPTMTALARQHRVVALDQRGHGRSTRRTADVFRDAYMHDVVALIRHVSPDSRVHLVGQSMGAHTTMLVAAAEPELMESVVLLEADVGALAFLGGSPIAAAWVKSLELRDGGLWPRFDADIMESCIRHVMKPRWDEWFSVQARTLVVYADGGMFTEAQKAAFVSRWPGTLRVDLANGSHDAYLDQFEAWVDALRGFLSAPE
ncbi:MAG: alpha/beta fold hydrolase [Specibacter sp.]